MILSARQIVAREVNAALVRLHWQIGQRIRKDILKEQRAEYGEQIVAALGRQLEREFGRGFNEKNLWRTLQFAGVFPDRRIVVSLIRELSWTHFLRLIPIEDRLKRDFYSEMCRTLLTQHCLPTSKTAIATFCHQILGEIVRPHRRPGRKRPPSLAELNGRMALSAQSEPAADHSPQESPADSNGSGTPLTRSRGPRIAQVRMLKPEST